MVAFDEDKPAAQLQPRNIKQVTGLDTLPTMPQEACYKAFLTRAMGKPTHLLDGRHVSEGVLSFDMLLMLNVDGEAMHVFIKMPSQNEGIRYNMNL